MWAPQPTWSGHCGPAILLKFHLARPESNFGRPAQQVTKMTELMRPLHHCLSVYIIKELSGTKYSTCKVFTRNSTMVYITEIVLHKRVYLSRA